MEDKSYYDLLQDLGDQSHSQESTPAPSLTNNDKSDSLEDILFKADTNSESANHYQYNQYNHLSMGSDVLQYAFDSSGISSELNFHNYPSAVPASSIQYIQYETICFEVMPDDVQFRYQKEIMKKNTSPIYGRGGKNVSIKVNNLNPNFQYEVHISLVDSQGNCSIHEMYRTKGNTESFSVLKEKVDPERTNIILERIGVQRQVERDGTRRKDEKDSQDSVWMQAVLYRKDGISGVTLFEVNSCKSDEILDKKKWNLKIQHINPASGMETGKQEMTLLCSKIKPDTQVRFKRDDWVEDATIIRPHHGVALVLLTPTFPPHLMRNDVEEVKVVLYCRQTDREGPPFPFRYKADPSTFMRVPSYPMRERSPVRRDRLEIDSSVQEDAITDQMEQLKISAPTSIARARETVQQRNNSTAHVSRLTRKHTGMSELNLVREVACGKKEWCEEVKTVINRSPFILHVQDKHGRTPPMLALTQGYEEVFKQFMEATDEDNQRQIVSSQTPQGVTLLHVMAIPERASVETLKYLLKLNADPRLTDRNGQTMVHWLVQRQRISLLRAAIPAIRRKFRNDDARSVSSTMSNFLNHTDNDGRSALHIAVLFDVVAAIEILVGESVDVNNQSRNGMSALHMAVVTNNAKAVDQLVKLGAQVNAKTQWGANVRQLAEQNSSLDSKIIELLNDKCALSRRNSGDSSSSNSGRSD